MRIITKSENIQPTKTLLSVCIPSYNQLEELEETLLEIESQLREGSLPLEVLVSDNKSQNRAEVGNLKRRFSSYRWFLQESNLGFGATFPSLQMRQSHLTFGLLAVGTSLHPARLRRP